MASHSSLLRVSGTDVVDGNGKRVILKGVSRNFTRDLGKLMANASSVPQEVT